MEHIDFAFLVGGEAGAGVMLTGRIISKIAMRSGYEVFATNEYPSLIRGGHNWFLGRVSTEKVHSQKKEVEILVALDELTLRKHEHRLSSNGIIISEVKKAENALTVPMTKIARNLGAPPVARNMVAVGAVTGLLGIDTKVVEEVIADAFQPRGKQIVEINKKLAKEGYSYGEAAKGSLGFILKKRQSGKKLFLTGNDATALGALAAGMRIYFAYPMTPASPILHYLAAVEDEAGIVVIQPESEIAAINMATGAAYAGARCMVATSGGGFALMTEALGQLAMTETPLVIVEVQRPGPSTGLPTHTGQGDLRFVMHASQGEFPRFVIAPGDHEESFYLTAEAFNLAERYQTPVIILSDKYLAESYKTVDPFDQQKITIDRGKIVENKWKSNEPYKRFLITSDGVSPRAFPGTENAIVRVTTGEHTEEGYGTDDPQQVVKMFNKRMRKLEEMRKEVEAREDAVKTFIAGNPAATIITWGSVKGPVLEAQKMLQRKGYGTAMLQIVFLEPFPKNKVSEILRKLPRPYILAENNATGQLGSLLREHLCLDVDEKLLKYNGRPFYPEEIAEKVEEAVRR